jgi:hypothetical protein
MFCDRNTDESNANRSQRLAVTRSLLRDMTSAPTLRILLTARGNGLWIDGLRQGINSGLGRHCSSPRCCVAAIQSRYGCRRLVPPKVALY